MDPIITLNDLRETRNNQQNDPVVIEDPNLKYMGQVDGKVIVDPTTLPNKNKEAITIPKGAKTGAEALALNEFDKVFGEKIKSAREDIEKRIAESQIYEEMIENGTLDEDIKSINMKYDDSSNDNEEFEQIDEQENIIIQPLFNKEVYYHDNGSDIQKSPDAILKTNNNQDTTIYPSDLGAKVPNNWEYSPINRGNNMENINNSNINDTNNRQVIKEENKPDMLVVPKLQNRENINLDIDKKINFEDVTFDDDDFEEDYQDKSLEDVGFTALQHDIANTIIPVAKRVNLAAFTVSKKPVSIGNVIKNQKSRNVVAWPLINTGKTISIKSFDGMELQAMNEALERARSNINNAKQCYQLLYEHCIDPDKPATMESWLNSICFTDEDGLFAASYASCFNNANYIPRECDKDHHMFLTKNIDIMDMMEFQDKKTEKIFHDIISGTYSSSKNWYDVVRVQISDNIVADIKVPSIYDKTFKYSNLDKTFMTKYASMINLDMYIDELYLINLETNKLDKIYYKEFPTDKTKELKQRIVTYAKLIKSSLNSDQLSVLISYTREINMRRATINFFIPETTCPKCGSVLPKEQTTMSSMLFTRHQLGQWGTIQIN